MKKISSLTNTATNDGLFTNGSVASGVSPTILDAGWFNTVQNELVAIVQGAGLTLDDNNDAQVLAALKALFSGGLIGITVIKSSALFTKKSLTKSIRAIGVGGGAAGGGTSITSSSQIACAWGGSAGSYGETDLIDATNITSVNVIIGTAGVAIAGANGGDGGDTSFGGYLVCPGGKGGGVGGPGSPGSVAADNVSSAACTGTNVAISIPGCGGAGPWSNALSNTALKSGKGGDSKLGFGGGAINGATTPKGGSGFGAAGGGNAAGPGATTAIAGGPGTKGVMIVMEFA